MHPLSVELLFSEAPLPKAKFCDLYYLRMKNGAARKFLCCPPPLLPTYPTMAATRQLLRLAKPRTVACIGRNYADHIAELGNTKPAEPFFFLKPASSLLQPAAGAAVLSPRGADLHYEVELAAVVGAVGADTVKPADALARVKGWAVAVDMTARNCGLPLLLALLTSPPCCALGDAFQSREGERWREERRCESLQGRWLKFTRARSSKEKRAALDALQGPKDVPAGIALHPSERAAGRAAQ